MAKNKVKKARRVTVVHVQVEVTEEGKLSRAFVTLGDPDNYDKQATQAFESIVHALDDVFHMMLRSKLQDVMHQMQRGLMGPMGHA